MSLSLGIEVGVEASFFDLFKAKVAANAPVIYRQRWTNAAGDEAGIAGTLQFGPDGLVAGLLSDGRLLRANRSGAGMEMVTAMAPVGVHEHHGRVYLVGTVNNQPAVSPLSLQGSLAQPVPWQLSATVASTLSAGIAVLDDRSAERNYVRWNGARSAIGRFPFLSAHDPRDYAVDVTGWLVAGPSYDTGGISYTAVAHVPIGISYP